MKSQQLLWIVVIVWSGVLTTGVLSQGCNPACGPGFVCHDGAKCECERFTSHKVGADGLCHPMVGAFCMTNATGSGSCMTNAHCQPANGNPLMGKCQCDAGYIGNMDGFCEVDYGGACNSTNKCNKWVGLLCQNGRCGCVDPALVPEPGRGCVALLGEPCAHVFDSTFHEYYVRCASNLACVDTGAYGLVMTCQPK